MWPRSLQAAGFKIDLHLMRGNVQPNRPDLFLAGSQRFATRQQSSSPLEDLFLISSLKASGTASMFSFFSITELN